MSAQYGADSAFRTNEGYRGVRRCPRGNVGREGHQSAFAARHAPTSRTVAPINTLLSIAAHEITIMYIFINNHTNMFDPAIESVPPFPFANKHP